MADVEIDGQKQLESNFKKITKAATNNIEQALINSALVVERDAKINAPVDTGRLRSSISHRDDNFGSNNPAVEIFTDLEYAPFVEYGTSKQSAKPFLFPAYNNNKQKILKELAKAFKKGVGL
jgi:HK97 gp10 family phage protein